jgi:predicted GTPase
VIEDKSGKSEVIIMGAAGRDFHNFNVYFRDNPYYNVLAFTAAQIPDIANRRYPASLAGKKLYPKGIPIYPEKEIWKLIEKLDIEQVVLAYSDIPYEHLMHLSAGVNAHGADFRMFGPKHTQLKSKKPVISVCAVRTGSGKSQTTRYVANLLKKKGYKVAVIRHPMPYGDLEKQVVQRFATYKDMEDAKCTIEEREEYEPHIASGTVVYAGVDYEKILRQAEKEADIILWDGGNNDFSFYVSDLLITVADPHRAGHEISYYPGEINARMADIIVVNKVDTAKKVDIQTVISNIRKVNKKAKFVKAASPITVEDPGLIRGKRVLVVEDGPTLTHGGMSFGAGTLAAKKYGATMVDPRRYAVGSIKTVYKKYPHLGPVLPAMGYSPRQIRELEATINKARCDAVIIGTPIDLRKVAYISKPSVRVHYELKAAGTPTLESIVNSFLKTLKRKQK